MSRSHSGETNENKEGILQGHLDTKLSTLGLEQSLMVANRLRNEQFTHVFTSDLMRAKRNLADFQGKPCKLFHALSKDNSNVSNEQKRWLSKVESLVELRKRVSGFFAFLCKHISKDTDHVHQFFETEYIANVLVVTHGGWLQELMRYFYKEENSNLTQKEAMIRKSIPNTAVSVFIIDSSVPMTGTSQSVLQPHRSSSLDSSMDSPTTPPLAPSAPESRYRIKLVKLHDHSHLVGECADSTYFNYSPPS